MNIRRFRVSSQIVGCGAKARHLQVALLILGVKCILINHPSVAQEKIHSLKRSSATLTHPLYMTTAAPLGAEAHLASDVDSQWSNNTTTDRNLSQIVENPLGDNRSFPRFSDEVTK